MKDAEPVFGLNPYLVEFVITAALILAIGAFLRRRALRRIAAGADRVDGVTPTMPQALAVLSFEALIFAAVLTATRPFSQWLALTWTLPPWQAYAAAIAALVSGYIAATLAFCRLFPWLTPAFKAMAFSRPPEESG